MSSPFIDLHDNPISALEVLGHGGTGLVILRDGMAEKIPLRYRSSTDDDVESNIQVIQHEQDVYRHRTVATVSSLSSAPMRLASYFHRPRTVTCARTYREPAPRRKALQLSWFRQMARGVAQIHDRSVIVADIASCNFLLDANLFVTFCDFTESSSCPLVPTWRRPTITVLDGT